MAARITSQEVGVGQYFRGPDAIVAEASTYVAWTMRNRIEVGEELQGPYGTFYRKEPNYTATFQYYDPYTIGPLPDTPDPTVLEPMRRVFDAPNRDADPLDGAIFFLSLEAYDASGRSREEAVQIVEWVPVRAPTPGPGTPEPRPYGLVFFKKL
jgi:hypothetical protein